MVTKADPAKLAYARQYYRRNRARRLKQMRAWSTRNKGRLSAYSKKYRSQNSASIETRNRTWRAKNKKHVQRYSQEYHEKNRVIRCLNARRYRKLNAAIWREIQRVSEQRRRSCKGTFNRTHIDALFAAQNGVCTYCSSMLITGFHIDHKKPLSRGGTNWPRNLQLTCATCNLRKHTMTHQEFLRRLKRESST